MCIDFLACFTNLGAKSRKMWCFSKGLRRSTSYLNHLCCTVLYTLIIPNLYALLPQNLENCTFPGTFFECKLNKVTKFLKWKSRNTPKAFPSEDIDEKCQGTFIIWKFDACKEMMSIYTHRVKVACWIGETFWIEGLEWVGVYNWLSSCRGLEMNWFE